MSVPADACDSTPLAVRQRRQGAPPLQSLHLGPHPEGYTGSNHSLEPRLPVDPRLQRVLAARSGFADFATEYSRATGRRLLASEQTTHTSD